jgi:hypothetical protein
MVTLASPGFAEYPISAAREAAIRECKPRPANTNHTWQSMQIQTYRSCMAGDGEPE